MGEYITCIILFTLLLVMQGCNLFNTKIIEIKVNHYMGTAMLMAPTLSYVVRGEDEEHPDEWYNFSSNISGFDDSYKLGYIYRLKVQRTRIPNPPEDMGMYNYTLEEILSEVKVDAETTFTLIIFRDGMCWLSKEDGNFSLLSQVSIVCYDDELITELNDIYENASGNTQGTKTSIFKHTFDETIKSIELIDITTE